MTSKPSETSTSMEPNSSQILIPTCASAYTATSNQNGSKNTMPSAPRRRSAWAGPRWAAISRPTPAMIASEHRAK